MARKGYEFDEKTKDAVYKRDRHKFPKDVAVEVDHIASIRECREKGIPPVIASSIINAQLLLKKDNREKSDKDADPNFVEYLLSLMARMF